MLQTFNEKNANLLININGELFHRDKAAISPFDSAVQGGDAVWEGLRLYDNKIFRLKQHLERLRHSAKALAFDTIPTNEHLCAETRKTLDANKMTDNAHIRLTLTRGVKLTSGMDPRLNTQGPTLIVLAEHKPPVYDTAGITLITSAIRRWRSDTLDPKIHHCNLLQSILAKIQANAAGVDDALMLDDAGFLAETNATHVFSDTEGVVETSRSVACPEGVTRSVVLELCRTHDIPCAERDISLAEVYRADEIFCTGTMGELAPVLTLDGRTIADANPGPMTTRLTKLFREQVAAEPAWWGE